MYGAQIAFKTFHPKKGIWGSPWVGFKHFIGFMNMYNFRSVLLNTIGISVYSLAAGFPIPILLALSINEVTNKRFKKTVQLVTYAPHFISTIVMVSMMIQFLSPRVGMINHIIAAFGGERVNFLAVPQYFKTIYVLSGIWQNAGYGSIIYLGVLSSIDQELYEAAIADGATKLQRIWYIDIPGIIPTATIMLILNTGRIMSVGFEKIFIMQNPLNYRTSEVIATYIYKLGVERADFSFASAIGLFNSVINLILIVTVNKIASNLSETSLW